MKTFLNVLQGAYFGAALSLCGVSITNWKFWVVFIPVTIIAQLRVAANTKE
jgi:hypothetical protein